MVLWCMCFTFSMRACVLLLGGEGSRVVASRDLAVVTSIDSCVFDWL